jgi:hypothetical protein
MERQQAFAIAAARRAKAAAERAALYRELNKNNGLGIILAQATALEITFVQDRRTRVIAQLTWHMPIRTREYVRQVQILEDMIAQYNEYPFKMTDCDHPFCATVYCSYHKAWLCPDCFSTLCCHHRGEC